MTRSIPDGEVRPLGDRAFLIGVADPASGRALGRVLEARLADAGAVEVVCGFATVMVSLVDPDLEPGAVLAVTEDVLAHDAARRTVEGRGERGRVVTVPCAFDGPDLEAVATRAGCSPDEVVALMTDEALTVAVVGFSPGFAYLDGLPDPLRAVPRHDRARPVVPAGSVALAGGHAAVYPTASPGGWQLVGRTGFPLFSTERPPYAVLSAGRPGQVHRGGRRRPARSGTGAGTGLVPAGRGPLRARGRGARAARRRTGRRPAGRGRASVCRTRPPPMASPSPWPIGSSATRPARAPWS